MGREQESIRWAPRVRPQLVRRLYEVDARGIVDEELVDEVGHSLLGRCETIRRVTERLCPLCGGELQGGWGERRDRRITCGSCSWQSTWAHYHRSYKRHRIHGGSAYECFLAYLREFPRCRTRQEKMLVIDRLIHAVHEAATKIWTMPAAVNLIQGKAADVIALLDDLASADSMAAERRLLREAYQSKMEATVEPTRRHGEVVRRRHEAKDS